MARWILAGTLLLASTLAKAEGQTVEWNGRTFHTYAVEPAQVQLFWQKPDGSLFRRLGPLREYLESQGLRLRFVMNGGLFEEGGTPCGLLVIDGKELHPLNMREGEGNFYLKPNGVFYIEQGKAHIVSSEEFQKKRPTASLAIQSGPLLLRNGQRHPAFRQDSKWALHRNGVGIKKDGSVLFAITEFQQEKRVTLFGFAEFFRAQGCDNALFLDGDISQAYFDPREPITSGNHFGAIFAVVDKKQ